MSDLFVLRPALPRDADDIARVHVATWQSTYAGLVPSEYLARMSVARSAPQWHRAAAPAQTGNDLMVAEAARPVVGFVRSEDPRVWDECVRPLSLRWSPVLDT